MIAQQSGTGNGLLGSVFSEKATDSVLALIPDVARLWATEAQLNQKNAQLSDLRAQVSADARNSILDIQSVAWQVEVARSNVHLAAEALNEAQQRCASGISTWLFRERQSKSGE